jgi:Xaa-Pro dipeptidase
MEHLTVSRAEALRRYAAVELLGDVGVEVRRLRLIKDSDEVAKLQRAAEITDAATEAVFNRLAVGRSELEVALDVGSAVGAAEARLAFDTSVQVGPNSALPHHDPGARRIALGDLILIDFGAAFGGYRADTTRVAVVGEPTQRQLEIHKLVLEAHDAAIAAVRPGVTTASIDKAARDVISAAGLGDRFFHRVGHGLGLEIHEDPSLEAGSQTVLEPGMVFTIEPGVYIPDWGGIRIEDDVVVERNGCRLLTKADRSLRTL